MIRNRDALPRSPPHDLALDCLEAGIEAALPERAVRRHLRLDGDVLHVEGDTYDLGAYDEVLVLGAGKAAAGLARTLESLLGDRIDRGVVVTDAPADLDRVETVVGEHPTPGEGSREGAERVLEPAREAGDRTLVLAPVTGGGSALLAAPAEGVTFDDLRAVTDALLDAGASIEEVNAVRKHLSAVKGGRLARELAPATVVGLLVSDVVGDDPAVIASGPLSPDPTTYADALGALDRYGIDAPASVREHLEAGAREEREETPKPGDPAFDRVATYVVANARTAVDAACETARERDAATLVLSTRIEGEASEAGRFHAAVAAEALAAGDPVEPPAVVVSAGETTVTVRGEGAGGPNCECALAAALDLPDGAVFACVDTDGRDGSTDAAGALVDAGTADDPGAARDALADDDTLPYLRERDAAVETGATGTNVNDLRVLVVGL